MPVKFSIKTKIKINGKQYGSIDEIPEDKRKIYEKAIADMDMHPDDIIEAIKHGGQKSSVDDWQGAERLQPLPGTSSGNLGKVYRRIWFFLIVGFLSMFPVLWYTSRVAEGGKVSLDSPYAWLFAIPAGLILYSVYISVRYWRCEHCGHSLPTHSYTRKERKCLHCGNRLDF